MDLETYAILSKKWKKVNISTEQIQAAVNDYLSKNPVQPTPIDNTLSMERQAADAKATGVKIRQMSDQFPNVLPNPHALTFTGAVTAEYDGSKPLTVNIPNGAQNASSGDTMEVIRDITMQEVATEVIVTTDEEGKEFALKELVVLVNNKPSSEQNLHSINVVLVNDDKTTSEFKGTYVPNASKGDVQSLSYLHIKNYNGKNIVIDQRRSFNGGSVSNNLQQHQDYGSSTYLEDSFRKSFNKDGIKEIRLNGVFKNLLSVGTRITIYGVRK